MTAPLEGRAAVYLVTFERGDEDAEVAASRGRNGQQQLADELQEACDASGPNGTYKVHGEKLSRALDDLICALQDDSNFADSNLLTADFADMAKVNVTELVKLAAPEWPEDYPEAVLRETYARPSAEELRRDRYDAARRLAAVALHIMVTT